jgi:hypothetical protein
MIDPKFLIVRYANGAAGKFLTTLLMSSESVAHFDPEVEQNKTAEACLTYAQGHFVPNTKEWLKYEPKHNEAWNLHHISSNYLRGEELSNTEFLQVTKQNATEYFWKCVDQQKLISVAWHKLSVPEFFKSAKFITIILDDASIKWYHRARWYKEYGIKDGLIHIKQHDPSYNNSNLKVYYDRYHNPYQVDQHPYSFIKENIINSETKKLFKNQQLFADQPVSQEFINLSSILDLDQCIESVNRICKNFGLGPIHTDIIVNNHRHWISCHNFKYTS